MPRWRTAVAAPRRGVDVAAPAFRPIRVVRVDVERGVPERDVELRAGQLVWVEAVRRGRVVGLVEARVDGEGLPAAVLERLEALDDGVDDDEPHVPDAELPRATVVVSTLFKRPVMLRQTLASLDALDYPDFDVVLVDNRRGDPGPPPIEPHRRLRVVRQPVPGISAGRNGGIAAADGEFVAFTDDDAIVEPGWLRAHGSRFVREPAVDAIGGLVLPTELETEAQLWFEEYYGGFSQSFRRSTVSVATELDVDPLFPYAPGRFGAGCNMAFRRSALDTVRGFDETLGTGTPARGGEDLAIFIHLLVQGGTVGFEPTAVVRHVHRRTRAEFLHQVRTYGTGLAAMYTSLVVRRPSTALELLRRVPAGMRLLTRSPDERSPSSSASYPRRALIYQVAGMTLGPFAYARSWIAARRVAEGAR